MFIFSNSWSGISINNIFSKLLIHTAVGHVVEGFKSHLKFNVMGDRSDSISKPLWMNIPKAVVGNLLGNHKRPMRANFTPTHIP